MDAPALRDLIARRLDDTLVDATFPDLPNHSRGKVRDSYDLPDGRRIMIATDRQSAFDQVLAAVPFKGQVLTETARFWFEATGDIVANHVIEHPDPNVMVVQRLTMLPVEIVVRDYLTGSTSTSIWPMYEAGHRRMYGVDFPDGLTKNQKLPETILTPTTKAAEGDHDAPITPAEIVEQGLLTADQWDEISATALALFARGREIAARNDKFSLGSFGTSVSEATFWVVLIYGMFINLQNFGVDKLIAGGDKCIGCLFLAKSIHRQTRFPDSCRQFGKIAVAAYQAEPIKTPGVQQIHGINNERAVCGIFSFGIPKLLDRLDGVLQQKIFPAAKLRLGPVTINTFDVGYAVLGNFCQQVFCDGGLRIIGID